MSRIVHISKRRALRDPRKWTPEEMLRAVADEHAADWQAAILIFRGADGCCGDFRSNVSSTQAIAMIEVSKAFHVASLFDEGEDATAGGDEA